MTTTRPVTTPNLHFAPPCAKPADHHDTPHKDGRLFNAPQKKRTTPRPQTKHRGQGSVATTRATCDVRAELRLVHWAWRGRGSPAPLEHDGGLGVVFFSVGRGQAPPPSAWLSPRHFSPSRVSFMRVFFASRCGFVGGRRLALCDVAERPRGMAPDAASERRWRWGASRPPIL
jgi:hypothetical protein